LSEECPHCGEGRNLPAGSRFCAFCGSRLAPYTPEHLAQGVLEKRDSLRGERKEVTILFADVAGSLAMAAALDPEDIHAVMDGFFAFSLEVVHAERGTINQFRRDGFMALFGGA
jgi:class 3 adenylate cyclase